MAKQKPIIKAFESMLSHPVWQHDKFLLRWAHDKIESKLDDLRKISDLEDSSVVSEVDVRVNIFVEIYQKDLGIITLSKVLATLGDRAVANNIYDSYQAAKLAAEQDQRLQKHIAFIEILVLPDKIIPGISGKVALAQGAILIKNVKGAWFRDCYYVYDSLKGLFLRS